MNISKLFGGNRVEEHPISSNRHKKLRYIRQGLEMRLGKETADQIMKASDVKYLDLQHEYRHLPAEVKQHTDLIFINAAVCLHLVCHSRLDSRARTGRYDNCSFQWTVCVARSVVFRATVDKIVRLC